MLFLLLSAFFSGAEIAFISASKLKVELKRKENNVSGSIVGDFMDHPKDFLATTLVGNNIALVVFTFLVARLLTPVFEPILTNNILIGLIITIITTIVVLIFGEYLPKTIFRLFADTILYVIAIPLKFFKYLFFLPTKMMIWLSEMIMKIFLKPSPEDLDETFTKVDLEHFIQMTNRGDKEEKIDTNLFTNAMNLNLLKVRECMIPRTELVAISVNSSIEELIEVYSSSNLSRIIVIEEDVDNVLGYVHHQQMLKSPTSIRNMIMDITFVPEVMNVHDLLNKFIIEKNSIAIVVDEFGGTSGVITMEDILEEIFGEIEDEHDEDEYILEQIAENEFRISGRVEVSDINEKFEKIRIPEGEYNTLSGYLVMTTQNIPDQGEEIILDGNRFVIESVSDTKIETIRLIIEE